MIIVRDVFRVKYGQAKAITPLWQQAIRMLQSAGYGKSVRLLTDVAGQPYYTIILESSYDSLAEWESAAGGTSSHPDWAAIYQKIIGLTETGHREILRVIE